MNRTLVSIGFQASDLKGISGRVENGEIMVPKGCYTGHVNDLIALVNF